MCYTDSYARLLAASSTYPAKATNCHVFKGTPLHYPTPFYCSIPLKPRKHIFSCKSTKRYFRKQVCLSVTVFQCCRPIRYWFLVALHHISRFTASSGVRLLCFIILPNSFQSHFLFILFCEQINIRLGYLLPPMSHVHNILTCYFQVFPKTLCVTPTFL
jgi:hypothetical protein